MTITKTLTKCLDSFDTWCLQKILCIPYTWHTTNDTVRSITAYTPVSGWASCVFWAPCLYRSWGGPSLCHCCRT